MDASHVMLHLGGDNAVGMLPEGPVTKNGVIKGKGIGFKYLSATPQSSTNSRRPLKTRRRLKRVQMRGGARSVAREA